MLGIKGYDVIPDFAIEITELYANHCTVSTHGETIDTPTVYLMFFASTHGTSVWQISSDSKQNPG